VCLSDAQTKFNCGNAKGQKSTLLFTASAGYKAVSPVDDVNLVDYIEKRNTGATPPNFILCTSNGQTGFACVQEICSINQNLNGANCVKGNGSFLAFSDSLNYVALSSTDEGTLLNSGNIALVDQ
jgi:hypothetical protein